MPNSSTAHDSIRCGRPRGQQGISAGCPSTAQFTAGKPTLVTSLTGAKTLAHKMTFVIKTETDVLSHEEIDWEFPHGTRIEFEFKRTMQAKKKLLDYLKYTAVVNPQARFRVEIDDESFTLVLEFFLPLINMNF